MLGLGYVGLPVALAAAEARIPVLGFDTDAERIAGLELAHSPVDTVSDADIERGLASGFLSFTSQPGDLTDAETYVICVPTPLHDRLPDLSMVNHAVRAIASALSPGNLVILESTTYPGTTEGVVARLIKEISGMEAGLDYYLAFSPERIDPGNPKFNVVNTPKIVGGVSTDCTAAASAFYHQFVDRIVAVSSPTEAETAKLLENTFRHVNIALANEMAVFCHELGIDLHEAISAAATKPFGFMPFYPGPGVGGHCIPIDPAYFSWKVRQLGSFFRFVELATEINDRMPVHVASRIVELLNSAHKPLNGSVVLLVGVSYKRDVGDLRESPAFALARRLLGGGATVKWYDPLVTEFVVDGHALPSIKTLTQEMLSSVDVAVLHTDHSCVDLDVLAEYAPLLLDTRGAISRKASHIQTL